MQRAVTGEKKTSDLTNAQVGGLLSAYAITTPICYLPSGLVADRVRTLCSVGFVLTAVLTVLYAILPSCGVLVALFIGMGVTTILIWWGAGYKLVRLISEEKEYTKNTGLGYGFSGTAGLLVGFLPDTFVSAWFGSMLDSQPKGDAQAPVYSQIFWMLAASDVVASAAALFLRWSAKKNGASFQKIGDEVARAALRAEKSAA